MFGNRRPYDPYQLAFRELLDAREYRLAFRLFFIERKMLKIRDRTARLDEMLDKHEELLDRFEADVISTTIDLEINDLY